VLVVGLGRSGSAAARLCVSLGGEVGIVDAKQEVEKSEQAASLRKLGVELILGPHRSRDFLEADMIVVSPGVPLDLPELENARSRDIEIIGELELAYRALEGVKIAAVTGTNGKSTVTSWLGKMLEDSGFKVFTGGNLGSPLAEIASDPGDFEWAVIEVSSFQLDTLDTFQADAACLVNLSSDHLNRYGGDLDKYYRSKISLLQRLVPGGKAVVGPDEETISRVNGLNADLYFTSMDRELDKGAFLDGDVVVWRDGSGREEVYPLDGIRVSGIHNKANALCTIAMARLIGAGMDGVRSGLMNFDGLPHRMEPVGKINGVSYFNDSKATNPAAVAAGLSGFEDGSVLLIAGGRDKGTGFKELSDQVARKVRILLLLGEAADSMEEELKNKVPLVIKCKSLKEAVMEAASRARPHDSVLLSPACASYDQFDNFEHRGDVFREIVRSLNP